MTAKNRRKTLPSAHYVAGLICGLSSPWQKWFVDDLKIMSVNPWEDVKAPKADKLPVKFATDEQIAAIYKWIAERFGDWPFPKLFLATKAYTGCRFADYRKANKEAPLLTTHVFRKRAFTMAWKAGIDARRASIAYGCNVDTLMRHYVDLDEQQVTDEVFSQMNGKK